MDNKTYLVTRDFEQIIGSKNLKGIYLNLKHLDVVEIISSKIDYSTPYGITNDKSILCKLLRTNQQFSTHYPWLFVQNTEENYKKIEEIHRINQEISKLEKQRHNIYDNMPHYEPIV